MTIVEKKQAESIAPPARCSFVVTLRRNPSIVSSKIETFAKIKHWINNPLKIGGQLLRTNNMSERFALINHEKPLVSRISFAWQKEPVCLQEHYLVKHQKTLYQQHLAVLFTEKIYCELNGDLLPSAIFLTE
jgi:hypothetical protein